MLNVFGFVRLYQRYHNSESCMNWFWWFFLHRSAWPSEILVAIQIILCILEYPRFFAIRKYGENWDSAVFARWLHYSRPRFEVSDRFQLLLFLAFHSCEPLEKRFPESCLLIVIGVVLGIITFFASDSHEIIEFDTQLFFTVILPPIIMEAGYFIPTRAFFDQLGTILLHAVVATLVSIRLLIYWYTC